MHMVQVFTYAGVNLMGVMGAFEPLPSISQLAILPLSATQVRVAMLVNTCMHGEHLRVFSGDETKNRLRSSRVHACC